METSRPAAILLLVLSTALIAVMGVSVILPVLPGMARIFALSPAEVGLLIACFTMPSALVTPVAGVLADRFGRKAVLVPGLLLFALGGTGCALSDNLPMLLSFRALQGLGAAPLGLLYATLVGDCYPQEQRAGKMGMVGATISVGTACYPALGGLLGELHWAFPFWLSLLALPVAGLALCVPLVGPRKGMDWGEYLQESRILICNPLVLGLFALTFLCFCMLYGPMITFVPMLSSELFQASPSSIGGMFTLASLGTALVAMNLARLGTRYSYRALLLVAAGLYLLAQSLMLALPPYGSSCWILTVPVFLSGMGQGLTFPLLSARLTSLAPTRNRAIVMAVNGTVLRISQSVSPLFFGIGWAVLGWPGPYVLGIGVSCCMAWLVWNIPQKKE